MWKQQTLPRAGLSVNRGVTDSAQYGCRCLRACQRPPALADRFGTRLFLRVLPNAVEADRQGNPSRLMANTFALYVNGIATLWPTFFTPKGGGQIKPSCFTDASLLSYNARSYRSKITVTFVSLSGVVQFRKTLVLIFIVWLNWFDTA